MTLEQVIFAKEIVVGKIREQGGELVIQLTTSTGKVRIVDETGFELFKVDKANNKARLFVGGRQVLQ